ncbi:MAG TPA: helix-turn-helix domain-containing protein [Ktedonobacterales bacterium]|jgi:predicted transcriptional regulator
MKNEPIDNLDELEHSREERAFTLYCQGMRVAEIAVTLAVSETTIRRWLRARLETLAQEERAERAEQLLRAIESQRSIASAAWRAYEQVRNDAEPDRHEGARYLSIALAAQREVARLQGLYYRIGREPAPAPVDVTLTRRPEDGAGPSDDPSDEARKQP